MNVVLERAATDHAASVAAFLQDGWTGGVLLQLHGVALAALVRRGFTSAGGMSRRDRSDDDEGPAIETVTPLADVGQSCGMRLRSRLASSAAPHAFGSMSLEWQLVTTEAVSLTMAALRVEPLHESPPSGKEARTLRRELSRVLELQVRGAHVLKAADFADRAWALCRAWP